MNDRYRVWWIPQVPMDSFKFDVPDVATGKLLCHALAEYDLFQFKNQVKPDYANAGGVEVFNYEENEWEDVEDVEFGETVEDKSYDEA